MDTDSNFDSMNSKSDDWDRLLRQFEEEIDDSSEQATITSDGHLNSTSQSNAESSKIASEMSKPEDFGLIDRKIPNDVKGILDFSFDDEFNPCTTPPVLVIGRITRRMMAKETKYGYGDGLLPAAKYQVVYDIIKALNSLGQVTLEIEKDLQIRSILETILGQNRRAHRPYKFPDCLCRNAEMVLAKVNCGLIHEEAEESKKSSPTMVCPSNIQRVKGNRTQMEKGDSSQAADTVKKIASNSMARKVMRGISKPNKRPALSGTVQPLNSKVYGHNSLRVGQWWPYRLCMLRDGAHGASQAGIAGTEASGAYSIVLSGGRYAETDMDRGTSLHYSGALSFENENRNKPVIDKGTKALQSSLKLQRPVRVFRASGSKSRFSPSVGTRYDGLYMVTEQTTRINGKGGAYLLFRLDREEDQPAIDLLRPNAAERATWDYLVAL